MQPLNSFARAQLGVLVSSLCWMMAASGCAESATSPTSADRALTSTGGAAASSSAAGSAGTMASAGASATPTGLGPAVDGAAPPDPSQAWSVADLLSHTELKAGDEVQVLGYAARVDLCTPCPADVQCDACFAQVAIADSSDAGKGPLVSVVGPFTRGVYDFQVGQRLAFRGKFKSRMPSLNAAAADVRYSSYLVLSAAP